MKIIRNEKIIARNGKIGQYTSFAGLIAMVIGVYTGVSGLTDPQSITMRSQVILLFSMIFGLVFGQMGNYFGLRYGRSPRPDEKLDASLKGLHSEFNFYHYSTPASHFLVGPGGAWVLLPHHQ